MNNLTLLEKITLFLFCLFLPGLVLVLILDMYSNYKVHQFYKYHSEQYVIHDYCFEYESKYFCLDDYFISE